MSDIVQRHKERQCPMCDYKGRCDHVRSHIRRHAVAFESGTPDGWIRVGERNMYVKVCRSLLSTGEAYQADKYPFGVCFDCCKPLPLGGTSLDKYAAHICASRRERPDLQGVKPVNRSEPTSQETIHDLAIACRCSITSAPPPEGADPVAWSEFKSKIAETFYAVAGGTEGDVVKALPAAVKSLGLMIWDIQKSKPTIRVSADSALEKYLREHPTIGPKIIDAEEYSVDAFREILVTLLTSQEATDQVTKKYQRALDRYAADLTQKDALLHKYQEDEERYDLERKAHAKQVEILKARIAALSESSITLVPPAAAPAPAPAPAPASKLYHSRQTLAAPAGGRELR